MRTGIVLVALLLAPAVAHGQSRFSLELGADVAVPVQDFGDVKLDAGLGLGANVRYRISPTPTGRSSRSATFCARRRARRAATP